MAFEELLQLVARSEEIDATQTELMRLLMLTTTQSLASGEMAPTDPKLKALAAQSERMGLALLGRTAASVEEEATRTAGEYAGRPGGEPVAEALHRQAATTAALRTRAEEFVAFMRGLAALSPDAVGSVSDDSTASAEVARTTEAGRRPAAAVRTRRRNAKYFGPQWTN